MELCYNSIVMSNYPQMYTALLARSAKPWHRHKSRAHIVLYQHATLQDL